MPTQLLKQRSLPELKSREEMLQLLQEQVYGFLPPESESLRFEDMGNQYPSFCAGSAGCNKIVAHCVIGGRSFDFPFYAVLPLDGQKHPFFVHVNFTDGIPDRYQPTEELAASAPRCVLVGSATLDAWADPVSEYLSCVAAKPAFGGDFIHPDRLPEAGEMFLDGKLGYHLRQGTHYFSRHDWLRLINFVKLHKKGCKMWEIPV